MVAEVLAASLSREEILDHARDQSILMWECPREHGRLILRPAVLLRGCWPSIIKSQLTALEKLVDPAALGITREECKQSIEELKKVHKEAHDQFMANVLVA